MPEEQRTAVGDPSRVDEFMSLFTRYQRHIYAYIRTLVPRCSDLDEIVQQTNAVLWEKFRSFESGTNFLAWALTVARFEVLHHRQRQSRSELLFSNSFLEDIAVESASHIELLNVKLEMLAECRNELSGADKDLLNRRYASGATSSKVATALGRPVVSVYKSLSRIRKRLFDCIERRLSENRGM